MKKLEILSSKLAHQGSILRFYSKEMKIPNGNVVSWDYIEHHGAAAIVAIKENGNIIFVRQYRIGTDDIVLEIPAGAKDSAEEDAYICAGRELEEETGYRTDELHHLIDYCPAPAYTSEKVGIYYTEKLIPSKQKLDENEFVELVEYSLSEAIQMIEIGEITDGKTIAAIFAYKNIKGL